jgi:hypothetical protein
MIILQQLIVASGALPELKRLLLMREQSEVQCHTAGTFRNLAAEDQSQVRVYVHTRKCSGFMHSTYLDCRVSWV